MKTFALDLVGLGAGAAFAWIMFSGTIWVLSMLRAASKPYPEPSVKESLMHLTMNLR